MANADARQHDRDAQLVQTLADIGKLKQTAKTQTPAQLVSALSHEMSLPIPLVLENGAATTSASSGARDRQFLATEKALQSASASSKIPSMAADSNPSLQNPQPQKVTIPTQDLKPLYDFALDCKSCRAKLAASQDDLADEKVKTAALTKERNAALKAAKGGSLWRRTARAAKWLVVGAVLGAIASRAAH
jgi:hypothetical protein